MMADRFRGFLPVVIDVETGGFDARVNPILEIAAVQVSYENRELVISERWSRAVRPFPGGRSDAAALRFTGIDPDDPMRSAVDETTALTELFRVVRNAVRDHDCTRAILVAHNAAFDQGFLNQAIARTGLKRNPFHPFSSIDTASLAAVAYGHTVLSEACARASIAFDPAQAHSALYDAERTAELFCRIVNAWPR
ncbi:MAG TPA: ribonuclease T [Gammaproteobacteria bacterium]|jgi:ribonuclease T|nr:ribonuclease T [Gammaproteobacteria bacterium]